MLGERDSHEAGPVWRGFPLPRGDPFPFGQEKAFDEQKNRIAEQQWEQEALKRYEEHNKAGDWGALFI
jgi:hypothetical protein